MNKRFSDGGDCASSEDAIAHGSNMFDAGADIVDVGGESTRPGIKIKNFFRSNFRGTHIL